MLKRWRSLRGVLVTWSVVPAMLILGIVALITFFSYQATNENLVIERDRELTYLSAARLKDELGKFTDELEALARTEDMRRSDVTSRKNALAAAARRLSVFDGGVVVLDTFGKVVATQPERPEIIGQDWSNREYFAQMLGTGAGQVFSDVLNDGPDQSRVVAMAVPVRGSNGEYLGSLAGMFRLDASTTSAFYASIVKLRLGENGSVFMVDGNGMVIYHSEFGRVGDNLSQLAAVREVSSGKSGAVRSYNSANRAVVAAYSPVPGTPWGLISEEDWVALISPSRRFGQMLLLLLAVGMFLPAAGVAFFVRQRHAEEMEQEHVEQEMKVARIIQQTLLPRELPQMEGWRVSTHWQPARAVGGDFYDFITLPDGRIAFVIGDVTDKGVPAALVMASTRSILRGVSERLREPGLVLERVNEVLCPDMPSKMFVTCLYAVLDPASGVLKYANAGQNLPARYHEGTAEFLNATGMPLGLMPGMFYEERETLLAPGETLLFFSDGLIEAHNAKNDLYGRHCMLDAMSRHLQSSQNADGLIDAVQADLCKFTGDHWEQEDDITLLVLERLSDEARQAQPVASAARGA